MKARKVILSIGIAILFVMFIAYSIETFYKSPKYDNFCTEYKTYMNQTDCEANQGKWTDYPEQPAPIKTEELITGYCDPNFLCNQEYEKSRESYSRNIFFTTLIIGIITVIISILSKIESVSTGFLAGGVILIIYGTIRYWGSLSDILRIIALGLALAVLVWIGYKKLK